MSNPKAKGNHDTIQYYMLLLNLNNIPKFFKPRTSVGFKWHSHLKNYESKRIIQIHLVIILLLS